MEIFIRPIGGIVAGLATYVNRKSGAESPWAILGAIGIRWNMVEFVGKPDNIKLVSKKVITN
jgi:hypothetical protein